jgi:hypothetical protein
MAFLTGSFNDTLIGIFHLDKIIVRDPFAMELHSPPSQMAQRLGIMK